ncbi:MAG: PQQ-dependent sugar dehydrogenase [Planctomycetota bacterium]
MRPHAACIVAAFAVGFSARAQAQVVDDARLRIQLYASGLDYPTTFAFLGADELLAIERRTGKVEHLQAGQIVGTALDLDVNSDGSRGGLGLVLDPAFASNRYVYIYYSATTGGDGAAWTDHRIERFTWNGSQLVDRFGPILSFMNDPSQENASQHNSGYLRFGPDGKLYGMVGDMNRGRFDRPRIEQNTASDRSSSCGALFRINADGSTPADNPFASQADPYLQKWFVYGFRNSFGIDFDPLKGSLWFTDTGPFNYDEINRADAGMNAGWLKILGPDARDEAYIENGYQSFDAADLVYLPGAFYRDPEFSFYQCIGITAIKFLHSKRVPEDLQDQALVSCSVTGELYHFALSADRTHFELSGDLADKVADSNSERDPLRLAEFLGQITDLQLGPDGYLYLMSYYGGTMLRLRPVTDLVEPQGLIVNHGTLEHGAVLDLERSDDHSIAIAPDGESGARDVTLTLRLNATALSRLDLIVEGHATVAGARQEILALDVPSRTWHSLDTRPAAHGDEIVTIADIASPADYIDPLDLKMRVRVVQWEEARGARSLPAPTRAMHEPGLRMILDQVRLLATYP